MKLEKFLLKICFQKLALHSLILNCRGKPTQLSEETENNDSEESEYSTEDDPSVVVQLSDRVQDGTRCRPGSLDMCIQGKCQVSSS